MGFISVFEIVFRIFGWIRFIIEVCNICWSRFICVVDICKIWIFIESICVNVGFIKFVCVF